MKTTTTLALLSLAHCCATAGHADTFGTGGNQFTIDFVTIGNPGNPADTTGNPNPAGSVPDVYRMGQYEVSRDMVEKASIEGGLGLTLEPTDFVTGGPRPAMPATGVSWNEAARFVNWLNTSEGFSAAYKFRRQPGDVGYNSNENILFWEPTDAGYDVTNLFRNSLAHYFLPSAHEWYKAAFYDPDANGGAGGYWNYPTGSDSIPTPAASGTAADTVVYSQNFGQGPADITLAGGLSPFGTMGQGGNAWEWEETAIPSSFDRGIRGGNWDLSSFFLRSTVRNGLAPTVEGHNVGFRVASIPEPSSAADFDSDGDVDGDDFLTWQSSFGVDAGGDADGDGDTDGDDFLIWQSQFGSGSGSASAAVPEPSSVLLLLGAAVVGMFPRLRRSR